MASTALALLCLWFGRAWALGPHTKDSSVTFKHLFLDGDSSQSCPDIDDDRSVVDEFITFCTLPLPNVEVEHTLSFWGWDQGWGNYKGSVALWLVADDGTTELLFALSLTKGAWRGDNVVAVKWYTHTLYVNASQAAHFSALKVQYRVGGGGGHRLNLRDVWLRPTSEDAGARPPRHCNLGVRAASIALATLCALTVLAFGFYFVKSGRAPAAWLACVLVCHIIAYSLMAEFVNEYPSARCKGDAMFISAVAMFFFGCPLLLLFALCSLQLRNFYCQQTPPGAPSAADAHAAARIEMQRTAQVLPVIRAILIGPSLGEGDDKVVMGTVVESG